MLISMHKLIKLITVFLLVYSAAMASDNSTADTLRKSIGNQMKKKKFTSFAFGMGISYSDNKSLNNFIAYELPNYNTIPPGQELSDFNTGIEFFGSVERQLLSNFSLKADYSYFLKSNNLTGYYPNSDFTYYNHQIYLLANYIIPEEYFLIKIGAGAGYLFSSLSATNLGFENSYTSTGLGTKLEGVINFQISSSVAVHLNGFLYKTFQGKLKDKNDIELKSRSNESVDLSSFGLGLRIGVEIYVF